MVVLFRDSLGHVRIEIDATYGISFTGEFAYFTDADGRNWKINAADILYIGTI